MKSNKRYKEGVFDVLGLVDRSNLKKSVTGTAASELSKKQKKQADVVSLSIHLGRVHKWKLLSRYKYGLSNYCTLENNVIFF